jgi:hypothetical protein
VSDGIFGEFGDAEEVKFLHDGLPLVFNSLMADAEMEGDLLDAFTIGD